MPVKSPRFALFDLAEGKSYNFRVRCCNSAGVSESSVSTGDITVGDKLGESHIRGIVWCSLSGHSGFLLIWFLAVCSISHPTDLPSVPGNPVVSRNTNTSVVVSWAASKDVMHLVGYYIECSVVGTDVWKPCNNKPVKQTRWAQEMIILE